MATTPNRGFTYFANQGSQYEIGNEFEAAVDLMLSSLAAITITTADHTVTATESKNLGFKVSGALTGNHVLTVPFKMPMVVWNATSGAHTLTVKYASDTGVVVQQGTIAYLYSDGSAVYQIGGTGTPTTDAGDLTTGTLDSARLETTPYLRTNASGAQSIPNSTDTAVTFDLNSDLTGTGITHSTTVNPDQVTVTRDGKYSFICSLQYDNSAIGTCILWLCKNGGKSDTRDAKPLDATIGAYLNAAADVDLVSGDVLSVLTNQNSGGALNLVTQQVTVMRIGN